jgi:hypothetical protein
MTGLTLRLAGEPKVTFRVKLDVSMMPPVSVDSA